jgi:hypothetical protein
MFLSKSKYIYQIYNEKFYSGMNTAVYNLAQEGLELGHEVSILGHQDGTKITH